MIVLGVDGKYSVPEPATPLEFAISSEKETRQ
jgi:hypothetical protein